MISGLITLAAFLIQSWYSEVNTRLKASELDHTDLQVLSVQVKNLAESQVRMLEKLDRIETKIDDKRKTN